jgi:branched-subunit amino acid aminotransferase/4-amino-4-deoxychorismate lyase
MSILEFKVELTGNLPISTLAKTLDEMTRNLPQGFYTTISTLSKGTKVLGFHAHLQRLYVPAIEQALIPSVDEPTLRTRIAEFAKINLPQESRIRLILTKNDGSLYVGIQPFEPMSKSICEEGVKVISAELARQSPRVKDTGFISASVEQRKQVGADIFEVLLTKNGAILEGMTSNFYAVKGKTLVTAQSGILLGVTRHVILQIARGQGISIEYRAPKISEIFDEAFLTSSSRGVVPIISIDNLLVGQGRVGKWAKMLSKAYQAYVDEKSERIVG